MTRRRIGLYGVHDESLALARLLEDSAETEVVCCFDDDPATCLERARSLGIELAEVIESCLVMDLDAFLDDRELNAVVDDGRQQSFIERYPEATARGIQVVSPLTARLLWGYGTASPRDRKNDLLRALSEVVESVELTIDSDELFTRMLEIAVGVTGAEGGSLMLLSPEQRELRVKVAFGVEQELWPKIRVALGEGIAGHVAATAQPLRIEGKADRQSFTIQRERLDVESALCVPLIHDSVVLGVLNLHHATQPGAFSEDDLGFLEQLAALDAQIIHRAQEHEKLRDQAARYEAVREIQGLLSGAAPLADRLQQICKCVADRMGNGIAHIYLCDAERQSEDLRLTATSLAGGGFGGEYRVVVGQGVDGAAASGRAPIFLRGEGGALAYAALPLLVEDKLVGVLSAQAGATPPGGQAAEAGLLEIAAALADGVARSRREAHISARATRMSAINETGIRMLSTHEVSEVARLATSSLAMILDADHAILRLQDPATRRYKVASYYGSADESLQPRLFQLDKQTAVEAISQRTVFLHRDLADHPKSAEFAGDFSSLIAGPLKAEGQVIGTLAIYDKLAIDRFFAGQFDDEDLQVFARFVSYVERALANVRGADEAPAGANRAAEPGLPNAQYLETRIAEEISRADGRPGSLAVASCRIENWTEVLQAGGAEHALHILAVTAEALRGALRDFDVLASSLSDGFEMLLPESGPDVDTRLSAIARQVSERICRDEALNAPARVCLAFGLAVHPQDGDDARALLGHAGVPRIRMV